MKTFIIYRKVQAPGNRDVNINYVKAVKGLHPEFTTRPSEAHAVGWLRAILLRVIFRFSALPVMQRINED